MAAKRTVPVPLQALLKVDIGLTNSFCTFVQTFVNLEKKRYIFKGLEISCHGLPWIGVWLAFIWVWWEPSLFQMQINFFIGLVVDIVAIAVIKAVVRRRRPVNNRGDMFLARGPDMYSFPSGHVSRAFFVSYFFTYLYPLNILSSSLIYLWAIGIAISRVLLKRHYLLDVLAGYLLAWVEFYVMSFLWLSKSSSDWIVEYLSDEKFDGGEFHQHTSD